ncbi:hypothetical protein RCH09_003364 [Actimicrobium sp. GrIS 1.19]|uniref:hypothetical protein n=1 Tax=Actimicrobium sp. GrIS 1.19 TaxID=3071708 RepID=UPI002DFB7211|nr:hypothetical protein [Actimicrobium sp. GrIS 1.19]
MSLKSRVERLEAAAPPSAGHYCLVVHGDDCQASKDEAVTRFVAMHGYAPQNFINVITICTETKRAICGCDGDRGKDPLKLASI